MQIFSVVAIVIIFILTLTLFISASLEYDLLNNEGKIKVFIFKIIPIFVSSITIAGEYLNFSKKKNKVIKIKIDLNDKQVQFFNDVTTYLLKKITPIEIRVNTLLALDNPFYGCLINGTINTLISVAYAYILSKNTDIKLYKNVQTGFRQTEVKFYVYISLLFSLYDYFWAYLKAYKLQKRREHEKAHKL